MSKQPHRAGQKIRAFRNALTPPLSAEDFADLYGFSRAPMYRWEVEGIVPVFTTIMKFKELGICEPEDWLAPALKAA